MTLRALVVDDEAPARKRLRDLISAEPGIELVGECEDGPAAVEAIESRSADVLFLDVQMPEMDGFDVLAEVGVDAVPFVVFVTAYDQHALAAFEARAIDYLLKPFTRDRFRETLERIRRAGREEGALASRLQNLLTERASGSERIPVKEGDRYRFLHPSEIDWIEADGNYVRLHSGRRERRVRGTLKGFTSRLGPHRFARIHQSYAVNLDRVREVRPWSHGELVVVLDTGKELVSSRTYSDELRRVLGI